MDGRAYGRGGPEEAGAPWNEIVPRLWMGGHWYRGGDGERVAAVARAEFDVVLSLYGRDGHGPDDGVEHHRVDIPDAALVPEEIEAVCLLADIAGAAVQDGRRVLVRCQSGYNRSGLVVVQTLVGLGHSVDDAISLVRRRRSGPALNNELFVDYLRTGLDVARLLTGLGA